MRLAVLASFLLLACTTTRELRSGVGPDSLEMLKKLEGSWVAVDEHGNPTDQVTNVFHVTAAGTAVQEVVFPGTEHEMVTLYFVQDGRLQLTHYCAKGNQPHMLAHPVKDANVLEFTCDGTGVGSEDEGHMHAAQLRVLGEGRLQSRWQFVEGGKDTLLADQTLARRQ